MDKKGRAKSFFLTLIFFTLGASGMAQAYLSVLNTQVIQTIYVPGLVLACIFLALVYGRVLWKRSGILTAALGAAYAAVIWYYRDRIQEGLAAGVQGILAQMNRQLKMNLIWQVNPDTGPADITLSLYLLVLPLTALLAWAFFRRRSMAAGLLFLLPVFFCLWTGGFCSISSMVMMLVSFLGLTSWGKKREHMGSAGITVLCTTVLCLFTALAANYLLKPVLDRVYDSSKVFGRRIQLLLNEQLLPEMITLTGGIGGGTADGDLGRDGGFSYTGARMLEVILDARPDRDVYLKGFIGNTYTGREWDADSDERLRLYYEEKGWELPENYGDLMNLSFEAAHAYFSEKGKQGDRNRKGPLGIEVRRVAASGRLGLYPYGAFLDSGLRVSADGSFQNSRKSEAYHFYPISDYCWGNMDGRLDLGDFRDQEMRYRSYVYENYTHYPAEQLPRLTDFIGKAEVSDSMLGMQLTQYLLQEMAQYNMNVPACPEEEEFTEYFLFDRKEGYCVHFATAAVLMLRSMGIPARYVSGYLVPASTFQREEGGSYRAVVEDSQAHAWAEVYLDGIGWYPLETTPGGIALEGMQQAIPAGLDNVMLNKETSSQEGGQEPGKDGQEQERENPQEETEESPEASGEQEGGGEEGRAGDEEEDQSGIWKEWSDAGAWMKLAVIVGIAAAVSLMLILLGLLALFIRRSVILGRRSRKRHSRGNNERIAEIFRLLYDALVFSGLPEDSSPDAPDFVLKAVSRFPALPKEELETLKADAVRCNYGKKELSSEQVQSAEGGYMAVCRQLAAGMNRRKRMVFRLWKVFY